MEWNSDSPDVKEATYMEDAAIASDISIFFEPTAAKLWLTQSELGVSNEPGEMTNGKL